MALRGDQGAIPGIPQYGPAGLASGAAGDQPPSPSSSTAAAVAIPDGRGRLLIFWIEMAYMLVLLGVAAAYFLVPPVGQTLPKSLGPIPVGVPWFGALGAVSIGLQGVFVHRHDWDSGYDLWHIARPLVGIVLAIVAYLGFIAGILATGNTKVQTGAGTSPTDNIIYYLVAFIVGYREEVFRSLLRRLADVILTPGDPGPTPRGSGLTPGP
jgi:hypothetical protein